MSGGKHGPPRLYVIADVAYMGDLRAWLDLLRQLNDAAGQHRFIVQVRAARLEGEEFIGAVGEARHIMNGPSPVVLNGPGNVATELGYDGVHWPESRIPVTAPAGGPAFRTAAVHSIAAIRRAERAAATALVYSPVFSPSWKPAEAAGLEGLSNAVAATDLPVYALGGVSLERTSACLEAGAHGVATVSGIATGDAGSAVAAYVSITG
ncbi:MAG: thiamine phosphate synthase [Gammaproteobacteria bacterium]|nr:thiamine phosphate synthase [Gammaproteobacteria bacterium]